MKRTSFLLLTAIPIALACGASRTGWSKGTARELHESGELQVRRALVRFDGHTREFVLAWVGARIPVGIAGEIVACELVVYRDDDGDHRLDDGEALISRTSPQPGVKILFQDIRIAVPTTGVEILGRLEVRTGATTRIEQFRFQDEVTSSGS